jgi:RepB DNA-primase N-terminal domain
VNATIEARAKELRKEFSIPDTITILYSEFSQDLDEVNKVVSALSVTSAVEAQPASPAQTQTETNAESTDASVGFIDLDPEPPVALDPYDTPGFLKLLFEPGDWINLQFIHQTEVDENGKKRVDDNFMTLEDALKPSTLEAIKSAQDKGWNAFVTMNAFTSGVKRRRVCDVKTIRSVYLDFDTKPNSDLFKADVAAGVIPEPHFVIASSPNKFYVEWLVEGFTVTQQEALNSALQQRYGSDAASTDAARVLRLPGTRNLKYDSAPVVRIIKQHPHERYSLSDFKIELNVREHKQIDPVSDEKLQAKLDLVLDALSEAEVGYKSIVDSDDDAHKIKIVLDECLWGRAPEHHQNGDPTGAAIFISANEKLGYKCFHTWCAEHYHWLECRAELEKRAGHSLKFGESVEIPFTEEAKQRSAQTLQQQKDTSANGQLSSIRRDFCNTQKTP